MIWNPSEKEYKKVLITKGPLKNALLPWYHAMVLVGYETDLNNGGTIWIYKNSWGTNWGEQGYGRIKVSLGNSGTGNYVLYGSLPIGPFIPPINHAYWPAGFDDTIKCVDKDGDGYYNWGISKIQPETCSSTPVVLLKDCDDNNNKLGPFIADVSGQQNYNCLDINVPTTPTQIPAYNAEGCVCYGDELWGCVMAYPAAAGLNSGDKVIFTSDSLRRQYSVGMCGVSRELGGKPACTLVNWQGCRATPDNPLLTFSDKFIVCPDGDCPY